MATPPRKHRLSPRARRALELLAGNALGVTEALMLAHGFTLRMLAGLVRVGLAREQRGVFGAGGKTIKIVRVEITAAGRRAIEVDRALWRQRSGETIEVVCLTIIDIDRRALGV